MVVVVGVSCSTVVVTPGSVVLVGVVTFVLGVQSTHGGCVVVVGMMTFVLGVQSTHGGCVVVVVVVEVVVDVVDVVVLVLVLVLVVGLQATCVPDADQSYCVGLPLLRLASTDTDHVWFTADDHGNVLL